MSLAFLLGALLWVPPTSDPDNPEPVVLEPVVVLADIAARSRPEIPASVSLFDAADIDRQSDPHLASLIQEAPNLGFAAGSNRPRFFQIRGVGELQQYEGAPNPSVGIIIDDIDFSGIGGISTLFDVDQVEVLRGPQATAFGASALGGLIHIRSRGGGSPGVIRVGAGTESTREAGVAAGGMGLNQAWRLSAHHYRNDGFRENRFLDRQDTNAREETTLRGRWEGSWDSGSWRLSGLHIDLDNGYDAFVPDNSFQTRSDRPGRDAQRSSGGALRLEQDLGAAWRLLSISSGAVSDIDYSFDGDWGNPAFWAPFVPYDFFSSTIRERSSITQELRLIGRPQRGGPSLIAGVYGRRLREDNRFLDDFNGAIFRDVGSQFRSDKLAVFGQAEQAFGQHSATLGLRVEQRLADYTDSNALDLEPDDLSVGGHVAWNWRYRETANLYARAARGFKAGGVNLAPGLPEDLRLFDTETLWNFETGMSAQSEDLRLDLSAFYMLRRDIQLEDSIQLDPTDPLTFLFFTSNTARGSNIGLEASWDWRVNSRWRMFGSLGLLDTAFSEASGANPSLQDRAQAHAPNYQLFTALERAFTSSWRARLEFFASDAFFFDVSHDRRSDPYQLLDAFIEYQRPTWQMQLYARNLFATEYATRGFFFGLEPPDFPEREYIQLGDGRLYGVRISSFF